MEDIPDPKPPNDDGDSVKELDVVGAKTIELYQNHLSLADRIWAYFSQYSALLVILSGLLALGRQSEAVMRLPLMVMLAPMFIYIVFALGNHRALSLTLDELQIIKGIAATKTRYNFTGSRPGTIMRFHLALIVLVSGMYLVAWGMAAWARL